MLQKKKKKENNFRVLLSEILYRLRIRLEILLNLLKDLSSSYHFRLNVGEEMLVSTHRFTTSVFE